MMRVGSSGYPSNVSYASSCMVPFLSRLGLVLEREIADQRPHTLCQDVCDDALRKLTIITAAALVHCLLLDCVEPSGNEGDRRRVAVTRGALEDVARNHIV